MARHALACGLLLYHGAAPPILMSPLLSAIPILLPFCATRRARATVCGWKNRGTRGKWACGRRAWLYACERCLRILLPPRHRAYAYWREHSTLYVRRFWVHHGVLRVAPFPHLPVACHFAAPRRPHRCVCSGSILSSGHLQALCWAGAVLATYSSRDVVSILFTRRHSTFVLHFHKPRVRAAFRRTTKDALRLCACLRRLTRDAILPTPPPTFHCYPFKPPSRLIQTCGSSGRTRQNGATLGHSAYPTLNTLRALTKHRRRVLDGAGAIQHQRGLQRLLLPAT